LINSPENNNHFVSRIIPLNNDHPNVPRFDRFRPIIVNSPLIKLLEGRFLEKLNEYLVKKMFPGQVGFVPGCGVLMNLTRAVEIIQTETVQKGNHIFAIFVDFANAYNSVKHDLLFSRLKGILSDCEIDFVRAIYSRNRIKLGRFEIRPNVGVAQGSLISPSLFDIYIEGLLKGIVEQGYTDSDRVLAYADDLLVFVRGYNKLRDTINYIEEWSQNNGMKLNKSKSAIVEFTPRRTRKLFIKSESVLGVPVLPKYKYLGLWLNRKITLDDQLEHIWKKTNFIALKLSPLLHRVLLDYRRNLWRSLLNLYLNLFCQCI